MNHPRRQLTLFVDEKYSTNIETIRQKFNPQQFELIKAHVTLCREDEIEPIERILHNLTNLNQPALTICFGKACRFSDGKGLYLPAQEDLQHFKSLRSQVLRDIVEHPRNHEPHITLMHPRNSTCTEEIYQQIAKITLPSLITFEKISLIEQLDQGPWKIIQEFDLKELA